MDSVLRDLERERSKMQTDVENFYRHYDKLAGYVRQYLEASTVEWARLIISHPRTLLLVVETTKVVDEQNYSYSGESEPIRLTTLSPTTGEMWDQLLHPTYSKGVQGVEYHGLTWANVEDQPTIKEAWPGIVERLEDHHVIIFGADYARQAIKLVHPTSLLNGAFCLHNRVKEFYGEFYELSLERVLSYQGINKKREQLCDSRDRVLMLAQVVNNLAVGMPKQTQEDETSDDLGDLSEHPF